MKFSDIAFFLDLEKKIGQLLQGQHDMSAQFDTLNAVVSTVKSSNDTLIGLVQALKAAVDAGQGLTAAEVQTLSDSLNAIKTADDGAVTANTPTA